MSDATDDANQDAHDLVHYQLMPDIPRMVKVLSRSMREFQRTQSRASKLVLYRKLEGKDGYERTREFELTQPQYRDDPRLQNALARRDKVLELERAAAVALEQKDERLWVSIQTLIEKHMKCMGAELDKLAADAAKQQSNINQILTRLADLAEDRRYNNKRIREMDAADPLAATNEELERIAKEVRGEQE